MTALVRSVGLLVFVACTSRTTTASNDVTLPAPDGAEVRAPGARPDAPLSGWKLYEKDSIGQPCPVPEGPNEHSQSQQGQSQSASWARPQEPVCGTKNRVSLEIIRQASWGPLNAPCEPRVLDPSTAHGYARGFCTVGDELVISTSCYMCRIMNAGAVAHARLSELTAEQSQMLAQIAGLPTPPRDANEWRELSARAQATAKQPPALGVAPP